MPIAKHQILITVDGVKELQRSGVAFRCRYERVGVTTDGKPRYQCVYLRNDAPEALLVSTRFGPHGPEPRYFNLWPGLFAHHHELGDGRRLCFDREFNITVEGPRGGVAPSP